MIPGIVILSYSVGGLVFAIGLATMIRRGEWKAARGIEKLILLGPLFYAMPLAAFGTEHFTLTTAIASLIPKWIPWHTFFAWLVGACFIAAALSIVTGIQARLAAFMVGVTFFCFVVLMDAPGWLRHPGNMFALTLTFRELAFSGGAMALAASLTTEPGQERIRKILTTIALWFVTIPVLWYSFEQFMRGDHVPGVPLDKMTPTWIPGHAAWTYLAAAAYAVTGVMLLAGKKRRKAAGWLGATVLFVVLVVYVPMAVADRASIAGLNFLFDTLMFCGTVLLLARSSPPR